MNERYRFWLLWFGQRFLWVVVTGLPACFLFAQVVSEIRFAASAMPMSGRVLAYGVQSEGIGASGLHGSWTKILYSPWIEVEGIGWPGSCRIEGQLGVFGAWLSDDELRVRQSLERTVKSGRLDYYKEQRTQLCRIGKTMDMHAIGSFSISTILSSFFAVWAYSSLRHRSVKEGKPENDIQE